MAGKEADQAEGTDPAAAQRAIDLGQRLYAAVSLRIDKGQIEVGEGACALALALVTVHRQSGAPQAVLDATMREAEMIVDEVMARLEEQRQAAAEEVVREPA